MNVRTYTLADGTQITVDLDDTLQFRAAVLLASCAKQPTEAPATWKEALMVVGLALVIAALGGGIGYLLHLAFT